MKYVTKYASELLNTELSLNASGEEQDWELELGDDERIEEFIDFYRNRERNSEIDFALVSLIVASFEDRVIGRFSQIDGEYKDIFERGDNDIMKVYVEDEIFTWKEIKSIIDSNMELFSEIVRYWSCVDYDGDPNAIALFFSEGPCQKNTT